MIYGIDKYKDICGIEKITNLNSKFVWNDINYLKSLNYYISDEFEEKFSVLEIIFLFELPDKTMKELCMRFNEVNGLRINNIGGEYNQLMGFEIIDQLTFGWEQSQRYAIRDYENSTIEFYCRTIEIQ